jgi:hypothetical protein
MSASVRPAIPRPNLAKASSVPPPPVRERAATLDLEDDDIVGVAVAPIAKSSAPPPPPSTARSIPPAPASHVSVKSSYAPPPPASIPPQSIPAPIGAAPMAMPSVPPPAPLPADLRLSITDPTDVVFDGMYGLTFAKSPGEAAEMCAETLAKALGARAVVIHRHDLMSRELRAIGAHGDGDFDIIGSAESSEDDLIASAVVCNQKSVTMKFDGELPSVAPKRMHHVGAPRTVVAAPAMSWGRCLAIVEVIDADERYAARVADSATYVAEQLAQFLLSHAA